jgi:tRNA(fMet)-specific endonuclease VapC
MERDGRRRMGAGAPRGMGDVATTPVLDSDILIDYLRGKGPGRALVRSVSNSLAFRITAVTAFELALGRDYAHHPAPADALLAAPCLTLTRDAALRAGGLLRELRAAGAGIEIRDAMQAGICLHAQAPLVTRNVRHFARVPGLQVVEPRHWRSPT